VIVEGTKIVRRSLGRAACFCPFCRCVGPHRVEQIARFEHVYWSAIGAGEHLADQTACEGCGVVRGFSKGAVRPAKVLGPDLTAQAAWCGPLSPEQLAHRLDLESRVDRGRLTHDERLALLAEPFRAIEYSFRAEPKLNRRELVTVVVSLLMCVGLVGAILNWTSYMSAPPRRASQDLSRAIAFAGATIVLGAIAGARMLNNPRVIAHQRVLGPVANSLAPLAPSAEELRNVMDALAAEGVRSASAIEPEIIARAAARVASEGGK
jgi:hypothetical protein